MMERQLCTFMVDGCVFAVDVMKVQEVLRYQDMTRVPLAHPVVAGLINLRGQIVTAIDLRRRLESPGRDDDELPMNVVIRTEGGVVSLLVDEIGDVVSVTEDQFEPPPVTLKGNARRFVDGIYKLERQILLFLDLEETVSLA